MNIVRPPESRSFSRSPEGLDGLLSAFLRSEMPDPWPALPRLPDASPRITPAKTGRWFYPGSRFALAATLAACLVASLSLPSLFPYVTPTTRLAPNDDQIATRPSFFKDISPEGRKVKGEEKQIGNTVVIKVELDDMP
jgi:hypothetical protein